MARVSVRGLTKVFPRRAATRRKGISSEGLGALGHLLRQMVTRDRVESVATRDDGSFIWALDDVTFEVAPGEVLGIIGRNGAGKSTLLKILARVLHPTAGEAVVRGRVVSMLELGLGFAPELTVRQNVQIQGRLAGIPAKRIRAAEDAILNLAGLAAYADVPLGSCPSGSAVQLGFAAVIGLGADVILADEVLAVGDSTFRRACEEHVRTSARAGQSILFVSHDMAAIGRICTRVLWIDRGRVVRVGSPEEVVRAYTTELLAGRLLPPLTRDGLAASCALLDVRLLDGDRAQVGALQLTEPGYVDCLFRIERPDVFVVVQLELWHRRALVFRTSSPPVTSREPSTYRAGVRIPADFLNEQRYRVLARLLVAGLTVAGGEPETVVASEEQLEFTVMNPHPERSVWREWPWGRGGLLAPRLPWRLEPNPTAEPVQAATVGS